MAYAITSACSRTKDAGCTYACPSDAIHPAPWDAGFSTATQLYINPQACSDCGLCVSQCPANAIVTAESDPLAAAANAAYYGQ